MLWLYKGGEGGWQKKCHLILKNSRIGSVRSEPIPGGGGGGVYWVLSRGALLAVVILVSQILIPYPLQ